MNATRGAGDGTVWAPAPSPAPRVQWVDFRTAPVPRVSPGATTVRRPLRGLSMALLLAENQVHHPAAADVRPLAAAVGEDFLIVAAGVEQRVVKDRHSVEGALL